MREIGEIELSIQDGTAEIEQLGEFMSELARVPLTHIRALGD
jgi:hypothetical protein